MCKMYLKYLALLGIFTIHNVHCYSAHRYPRLTVTNANPSGHELVIPARYKVKGKPADSTVGQNIHANNFPEVEYPSSIMDSSKPFYLTASPFSNDVKSTFKTISTGSSKATPTIVINLKKDKSRSKSATPQKEDVVETSKGNKTISNDKSVNNTANNEPTIIDSDDDTDLTESPQDNDKQLSPVPPEEEIDDDEMDYVCGIIDDLDEFITTLTDVETEIINLDNSTTKVFDSVRPKKFVTITSDVTSISNDSAAELNEGTLHTEPNPFTDMPKDSSSMDTLLTNQDVTEDRFSKEMQSGTSAVAHDDNSS